jgi:trehalose-6-phosphate synthase
MSQKRLLFISHQLPFHLNSDQSAFILDESHQQQYSGAESLTAFKVIHIGYSRDLLNSEQETLLFQKHSGIQVKLEKETAQGFYEGYCKTELWPLFHYILWDNATDGQVEAKNYEAYRKANELFCKQILKVYQEGDLIWIQDYHLLLLPGMVRAKLPKSTIGFFMHTPFPSSEIFRCLPKRSEILKGVLGANLVGFQTYSHARHFISSCTRVIGCESSPSGVEFNGWTVSIGIFPMGINLGRLEGLLTSEKVKEKIKHIRAHFGDKKIIVGSDTMDHVKGIQHKLDAFEKFFEMFPEWRQKVLQILIVGCARTDIFYKSRKSKYFFKSI